MNIQSDVVRNTIYMKCTQVIISKKRHACAQTHLDKEKLSKDPCQSCQPRQLFLWQASFPSDALEQLNKPLASVSATPAATLRTRVQVEQVRPWITIRHYQHIYQHLSTVFPRSFEKFQGKRRKVIQSSDGHSPDPKTLACRSCRLLSWDEMLEREVCRWVGLACSSYVFGLWCVNDWLAWLAIVHLKGRFWVHEYEGFFLWIDLLK